MSASVANAAGRFFEDFRLGEKVITRRLYVDQRRRLALFRALRHRFAPQSAETFARAIGYPASPIDDLLAFHVVFGKTVPDVSLNAVANLGYADCRFSRPVFAGDTLSAASEVSASRKTRMGRAVSSTCARKATTSAARQ